MAKKNLGTMKVIPEFPVWIKEKRDKLQQINNLPTKITLKDTQKMIVQAGEIDLNKISRKMIKK